MRVAQIEFAWIEQVLSFANEEDKQKWLGKRTDKLDRRNRKMRIVKNWTENGRCFIRIRLPYNDSPMMGVTE